MISPEALMLLMELQMASGLTYRSQPLSEARRRVQRLIFGISALSIPALIFAALSLAISLSGKAPPIVGLIELTIIGLNASVQVILFRRLVRLRQLSRADIAACQDKWQLTMQPEELAGSKSRQALMWTTLGFIPFLTVAAAPFGIVYAAEVLQLIRYFGVGEAHRTSALAMITINVVLMLIYASGLALLPLLLIRTIG